MKNKAFSWISFLFQAIFFPKVYCFVFLFKRELWLSNPRTKLNRRHRGRYIHPKVCLCCVFSREQCVSSYRGGMNMKRSVSKQGLGQRKFAFSGSLWDSLTGSVGPENQSALKLCWLGSLAVATNLRRVKYDKLHGWAESPYGRKENVRKTCFVKENNFVYNEMHHKEKQLSVVLSLLFPWRHLLFPSVCLSKGPSWTQEQWFLLSPLSSLYWQETNIFINIMLLCYLLSVAASVLLPLSLARQMKPKGNMIASLWGLGWVITLEGYKNLE